MSDEMQMTDVLDDNTAMGDDYFSSYEEVDEEGNPTVEQSEPETGKEQVQPKDEPAKPEQPTAEGAEQPQTPQGFEKFFYSQDEKTGESVFDADAAHGFLFSEDGPAFNYQRQQAQVTPEQMAQQAAQQQQQQQEDVPEWKKPLVERQKRAEELLNKYTYGIRSVRDQLGQNIDPQTAQFLAHQEKLVREYIEKEELPQWEYEREAERRKQEHEKQENEKAMIAYRQKADVNQQRLASQMGGDDRFNSFFFGHQGQDGKWVNGPVTDWINYEFDKQNPDKAHLQGQELQQEMRNWWSKFASEPNNLNALYEIGIARLQKQMWPKLVDKIGATKEAEIRGQRSAQRVSPNGDNQIQSGAQSGTGHESLDRFLSGPETV